MVSFSKLLQQIVTHTELFPNRAHEGGIRASHDVSPVNHNEKLAKLFVSSSYHRVPSYSPRVSVEQAKEELSLFLQGLGAHYNDEIWQHVQRLMNSRFQWCRGMAVFVGPVDPQKFGTWKSADGWYYVGR